MSRKSREKEPMGRDDQIRIGLLAGQAFSPSSPIKDADVFAGRQQQIRQVIDAINQDGQSVLIYGERGVGKTSLANVIDDFFLSVAKSRIFAPHIACDSHDDFSSIWIKVLKEKDRKRPTIDLSDQILGEIDNIIEEANDLLTPHCIKSIADLITNTHLFVPIIDEFDRVDDDETTRLLTDTIKYLSDHTRSTTVILVGVGDTVDDLIAEHESIERALIQVPMQRMSPEESAEILDNGSKSIGIEFGDDAQTLIIAVAQGLPHYTHLLGLNSVRASVDDASWVVMESHVEEAIKLAIGGSQQSLQKAFHSATSSPRPENLFRQVLLACALAKTDSLGYFAAADVREPMTKIMNKAYDIPNFSQHLKQFCEPERGSVLQRIGEARRYRFRFRNPILQPFVVMNGLKDGFISKDDIRTLLRSN